jgi:glucose-6-phosphate dehydrogenase assembly protein OpcA
LPNIVFSHLDSDLPFYLWWQGEFHDPMDPQLWTWVDRLIFDSQRWNDFDAQMRLIETAEAEAKQRIVLCDLNWTRLVQVRLALAHSFDPPSARQKLKAISRIEIDFASDCRSTAILLAGWLAAQLGWKIEARKDETKFAFTTEAGNAVAIGLQEINREPISRCSIFSGTTEFRVTDAVDGDLLNVSVHCDGKERMQQLMPASRNDPVRLMSEELMRGGHHRVYLRAVNAVRTLL